MNIGKKIIGILLLIIIATIVIFITTEHIKHLTLDLGDKLQPINVYDLVLWTTLNKKELDKHSHFNINGTLNIKNSSELFYLMNNNISNKIKHISGSLNIYFSEEPTFFINCFNKLQSIGLNLRISNKYDELLPDYYKQIGYISAFPHTDSTDFGHKYCVEIIGQNYETCPMNSITPYNNKLDKLSDSILNIEESGLRYKVGDVLQLDNTIADDSLVIVVTEVDSFGSVNSIEFDPNMKIISHHYQEGVNYDTKYLYTNMTSIKINPKVRFEGGTGLQVSISVNDLQLLSRKMYIYIHNSFQKLTSVGGNSSNKDATHFYLIYGQFERCEQNEQYRARVFGTSALVNNNNYGTVNPSHYPNFSDYTDEAGECASLASFAQLNNNALLTHQSIYNDGTTNHLVNGIRISKNSFTPKFKSIHPFPTIDLDINSASVSVNEIDAGGTTISSIDETLSLDGIYETFEDNNIFLKNITVNNSIPEEDQIFTTYVFNDITKNHWNNYTYTQEEIKDIQTRIIKISGNGSGAIASVVMGQSGNDYKIDKILITNRGKNYDVNSRLKLNISKPKEHQGALIPDQDISISNKRYQIKSISFPSPFVEKSNFNQIN